MPQSSAIRLFDALKLMDNKDEAFDLEHYSFDRTKKTGGKLIVRKGVVKCGLRQNMIKNGTVGVRKENSSHHPTPVYVLGIVRFNGMRVIL